MEEEQSRKDAIQVDLEELVPVIDSFFEICGNLERVGELGDIGVDKDGIGIPVNDLKRRVPMSAGPASSDLFSLTSSCRLSANSRVWVKISRPLNVVRAARGQA